MDRSLVIQHGMWRLLLAAIVALALVMSLGASPVAAASKGCSVKDKATGRTYTTLQAAVDAAKPKATLLVRGTCRGKTVIRKSLRVRGVLGRGSGVPVLRADGTPVLVVDRGSRSTFESLRISKSNGVINRGTATFVNVRVSGHSPSGGRGILNTGTLRLLGDSWVRRTSGVINTGHLTLGGTSRIRSNRDGSIAVRNTGTIVMNGRSSIGDNCSSAADQYGCPAGRFLNKGRLVMHDQSSLSYQYRGEGIYSLGTMVMSDRSSVVGNWAGGVYGTDTAGVGAGVHNRGTLVMRHHSSIHGNLAAGSWWPDDVQEPAGRGGGVYNSGRVVMQGSAAIHDNEAEASRLPAKGGGIYNAEGGTLIGVACGPGGNVYGNLPDDCYLVE